MFEIYYNFVLFLLYGTLIFLFDYFSYSARKKCYLVVILPASQMLTSEISHL